MLLTVTNNGGSISFTFTDLATNEVITYDNPKSGEYVIPLNKGKKIKLAIIAHKAIGSYKIEKKRV